MKRCCVLILVSIFLGGCTKLEMALKWADTFVMAYLSDYFELTAEQKELARKEFKTDLHQVQINDFPLIAITLERIATAVEANDFSVTTIRRLKEEIGTRIEEALKKFEPFGQKLIAAQAENGFDTFDKKFFRQSERDLTKASDSKTRERESRKRIKRWVSETIEYLSKEQESDLQTELSKNGPLRVLQIQSRQSVFKKFMLARANEKERRGFVHDVFYNWDNLQTLSYKKARQEYEGRFEALIIRVCKSLYDEQKTNLVRNLKRRAEDFKRLAQK